MRETWSVKIKQNLGNRPSTDLFGQVLQKCVGGLIHDVEHAEPQLDVLVEPVKEPREVVSLSDVARHGLQDIMPRCFAFFREKIPFSRVLVVYFPALVVGDARLILQPVLWISVLRQK